MVGKPKVLNSNELNLNAEVLIGQLEKSAFNFKWYHTLSYSKRLELIKLNDKIRSAVTKTTSAKQIDNWINAERKIIARLQTVNPVLDWIARIFTKNDLIVMFTNSINNENMRIRLITSIEEYQAKGIGDFNNDEWAPVKSVLSKVNPGSPLNTHTFRRILLTKTDSELKPLVKLIDAVILGYSLEALDRIENISSKKEVDKEQFLREYFTIRVEIRMFLEHLINHALDAPANDSEFGFRKLSEDPTILHRILNDKQQNLIEQVKPVINQIFVAKSYIYYLEYMSSKLEKESHPIEKFKHFTNYVQTLKDCDEEFWNLLKESKDLPEGVKSIEEWCGKPTEKNMHVHLNAFIQKVQKAVDEKLTILESNVAKRSEKATNAGIKHLVKNKVQDKPPLNITMVAVECDKVLKQGGLAEAVYGLSKDLTEKNHNVRLIMPKYITTTKSKEPFVLKESKRTITDPVTNQTHKVFKTELGQIKVYFVDGMHVNGSPENNLFALGKDNTIYEKNNDEIIKHRFAKFSNLAAELAFQLKSKTDVYHLHDWHSGGVARLLKARHQSDWDAGNIPAVLYTFHNNSWGAQGHYYNYPQLLSKNGFHPTDKNLFVSAVDSSDMVTTVSEKFAMEAQSAHLGFGMESKMRRIAKQGRLAGILNGSNPSTWNPSTDLQLAGWKDPETGEAIDLRYGPKDDILEKKAKIKVQLNKWFKKYMPTKQINVSKPIVSYIGRYDSSQKGLSLFKPAMEACLENGAQFISMGSQEDDNAKGFLDELEKKNAKDTLFIRDEKVGNKYKIQNGQDGPPEGKEGPPAIPGIGSLVRAVSDFMLVPSEFEPCGLVQFEGWLFGALTIASATGGLADTVATDLNSPGFNGFTFERKANFNSPEQKTAVREAIKTALDYWAHLDPKGKNALASRIMKIGLDAGWSSNKMGPSAVDQYLEAYAKAISNKNQRNIIKFDINL